MEATLRTRGGAGASVRARKCYGARTRYNGPVSNCGDDVQALISLALLLSEVAALVPFAVGLRRGSGALGCGISTALALVAPLVVVAEPVYIDSFRPLLECGSVTRVPTIVGIAPLLVLIGASALALIARER